MSATCATCKHFDTSAVSAYSNVPDGWGHCELAQNWGGDKPEHPETLAYAQDAESYAGWLVVSPDFGCVQHDEATPKPEPEVVEHRRPT